MSVTTSESVSVWNFFYFFLKSVGTLSGLPGTSTDEPTLEPTDSLLGVTQRTTNEPTRNPSSTSRPGPVLNHRHQTYLLTHIETYKFQVTTVYESNYSVQTVYH